MHGLKHKVLKSFLKKHGLVKAKSRTSYPAFCFKKGGRRIKGTKVSFPNYKGNRLISKDVIKDFIVPKLFEALKKIKKLEEFEYETEEDILRAMGL